MSVWRFLWAYLLVVAGLGTVRLAAQPAELPQKNIIFHALPEKLGLSQSSINCILQDRTGYLWIGTWSGLIRYDGYTATVFHSDNAPDKIRSNKITTIYEDRKGSIWIGTHRGGLFRYDHGTDKFTHFQHQPGNPASLSNDNVWALQEDDQGQLWVGTEYGLNLLNEATGSFRAFVLDVNDTTTLSQPFVTDIFLSSTGDLWVGTEYGLNRMIPPRANGGKDYMFVRYLYNDADPADASLHHHIYHIEETRHRGRPPVIWYSTKKGIKRVDETGTVNYIVEGKSSGYNLFRAFMVVDGEHPYILAGSEMGLNFFDPEAGRFMRFLGGDDRTVNLSHNTVTSLFLDRGGVLWVGTKKGLNKYDSYAKGFAAHKTSAFDPTRSIITGLRSARDGGYWISTLGGGLFRFTNGTFRRYTIRHREANDFTDFIQVLFTDSRGNVWVSTAGDGVYTFSEKVVGNNPQITQFKHYGLRSAAPISDDYVMSFAEDVRGNIWLGTWSGGLNMITPEGRVVQYQAPLLERVPMVVMHADHAGALWIGSRGNGLYRVRRTTQGLDVRHYYRGDSLHSELTNNFINAMYEDHAGGLWIGTEGGLNTFDRRTETFRPHAFEAGPSNNVLVSILEDDSGKLWLAHWDGLTVIDPGNPHFVKSYDSHDRIQGGFFYNHVCYKDPKGLLLFGGSEGFNIIDPAAAVPNPVVPNVVISDFQVFNKPVPVGAAFGGRVVLEKPLAETSEVTLKHFENSISFEFTALMYAAPEKTRYAYKLEGFDKDWNYTQATRRYANYTNLNPGHYQFKVKATTSDGVWSEAESEASLVILPPWWKTTWAAVGYVLASLLILHFFRKLILMRANFRHDLKVERLQRENLEKLNQAKLQFFTNISHEFRTPLTLILGPLHSLLDSAGVGKPVRDQLLVVQNNGQRLLHLVNQLLDFRKAESGNLSLAVSEGNMVQFVQEVKLSFDALAAELQLSFTLQASSPVVHVWFDRDHFEKILFNLLSNAFKNTPAGGRVVLWVQELEDAVAVIVEDSGKGIRREHVEHIFQSFFSYDEDRHHAGTGIGLALTKSLIDMHQGTITVESEEHVFTRFIIRLRKGSTHFDASQRASGIEETDAFIYTVPPVGDTAPVCTEPPEHPEDVQKLLIVEDNAGVRDYIRSIFQAEYSIREAADGQEGLAIAQDEIPDIIISDVMMPVMDGITLCRTLKTSARTAHIPVILLTARTSLLFKVEGLETGADDYVTKPFHPQVLQLKVRNMLRRREQLHAAFQDRSTLRLSPKQVTHTSTDARFVQQVLESIERNMGNPAYGVEDLGRDVAMSRTQLYRKLKAVSGQSANEFIRTIRLKRAAQLLALGELTIAQITYEVGFNDLPYFRECFKKLFGVTPSAYGISRQGEEADKPTPSPADNA
ncbi:response regulator [Fulvivirgaceae bacterium PWU5]|uniref:histidine kinase n=1 Tax=Dawidia cretensis TaxID=2782350 RepID=A0AAP2DX78_9BACT|nr:two-component regulator propeller domain-containing protein [Dawidia cretensis]MBT1709051.1 response regulator [Dawidia cretensis]